MRYISVLLAAAAMTVATVAASAATLTTFYGANNGQRGQMFDVEVKDNDLTVTAFDLNLYVGTFDMEIYYREGSHVGNEDSPDGWILLDTTTITSNGVDNPTNWDIADLFLEADTTYSFYITNTTGGGVNYTNGTNGVGSVVAENDDLAILEGVGKSYAFDSTFTSRVFNGTIYYDVSPAPIPVPASLPLMLVGLAGLAGLRRARRKA